MTYIPRPASRTTTKRSEHANNARQWLATYRNTLGASFGTDREQASAVRVTLLLRTIAEAEKALALETTQGLNPKGNAQVYANVRSVAERFDLDWDQVGQQRIEQTEAARQRREAEAATRNA